MKFVSSFFVANGTILKKVGENHTPLTFEQVGQENGFMLYETGIDKLFTDPAKLEITEIHDRAYIFVNKEPRGVLSRAENVKSMPLFVDVGDTLQILVENQGRMHSVCKHVFWKHKFKYSEKILHWCLTLVSNVKTRPSHNIYLCCEKATNYI